MHKKVSYYRNVLEIVLLNEYIKKECTRKYFTQERIGKKLTIGKHTRMCCCRITRERVLRE